jgi:hypothetical protein
MPKDFLWGPVGKKNRRKRRDKSRLNYSSWVIYLAPGLIELFIYTLRVLVLSRADLRRHVNFVFQETASAASQNPSSILFGIHL